MTEENLSDETGPEAGSDGVPMPIVVLNRWILLGGVLLALLTRQPWITTLLFLMLAAAMFGGPRFSLPTLAAERFFPERLPGAEREDFQLARFNNGLALSLLGLAQLAFLAGLPFLGWLMCLMVAAAAGVALAGFCVGCVLFFQFRMLRHRLFGK